MKIVDKTQELDTSVRTEVSKADTKSGRLIDEASEYVKKYTDLFEPQMSVQSTTSKKKVNTVLFFSIMCLILIGKGWSEKFEINHF